MGRKSVHDDITQVLPWFVNGSLAEKARQGVIAHLTRCAECRQERDRLQRLQQMIAEEDGSDIGDYELPFRRLMNRIAVSEANRASVGELTPRRRLSVWVPYLGLAASIAVAVLFVALMNPAKKPPEEYRTLSSVSGVNGVPHRIALTFVKPIRAETLRAALIETHSDIVSGPDKNGTFIVEIRVPHDISDERFIESLRSINGVKYAAFDGKATDLAP